MYAKAPESIRFEADDEDRILLARLILLGVPPSEIDEMPEWLKMDVIEMHNAQVELQNWANRMAHLRAQGKR